MMNPVCDAAHRLETVAVSIRRQYQLGPSPEELPDERREMTRILDTATNKVLNEMEILGLTHRIKRIPI